MSRGRIIGAVVAVVVVLGIVVAVILSAQARVPQVSTAKVEKQNLTQKVTASGQTEADEEGDVFPPTQGTLTQIFVTDGQKVKAGQALATLDAKPLKAAVDKARADYLQAVATVNGATTQVPTDEGVLAANAGVSGAHAQYKAAKKTLAISYTEEASAAQQVNIWRPIAAANPASLTIQDIYNGKVAAWRGAMKATASAKAAVKQTYAGYRQALSGQETVEAQDTYGRDAANAGEAAAAAGLLIAEDNLAHATLTAPIDGVVTFNGAAAAAGAAGAAGAVLGSAGKPTAGSAVSQASAPFTVTQLDALNFNAQVDEADVAHVEAGQKATVTLDAFPGQPFDSKVVQVKTKAIQTSTGGTAFPVLISIRGTGKRVLVGMGGNVDVEVSGISDAVTVPVEALFDEGGSTYVYVLQDTTVHRTKVTTGVLTDTRAQILSGVKEGDTVALGGLSNLKDGMQVRVK